MNRKLVKKMAIAAGIMTVSTATYAATTGAEFKGAYDFAYGAATGYLGRGIAVTGGIVGLFTGAGTGRPLVAFAGVVLAVFGAIGPTIIDSIFKSAII